MSMNIKMSIVHEDEDYKSLENPTCQPGLLPAGNKHDDRFAGRVLHNSVEGWLRHGDNSTRVMGHVETLHRSNVKKPTLFLQKVIHKKILAPSFLRLFGKRAPPPPCSCSLFTWI